MGAGVDVNRVGTGELEAMLRQKDGGSALMSSPPAKTSSINPMGEEHDMSLLAGKHTTLLEDRSFDPAYC